MRLSCSLPNTDHRCPVIEGCNSGACVEAVRRSLFWLLARHQCLSSPRSITENLALRQQLLVLRCSANRPRLRHRDRLFWIALSQLWQNWRSIPVIVKPETVIKGHQQGWPE